MFVEIKVPDAGFSITEGTVVEWHKNIGEEVKGGEPVVSVETDKIVIEIPALSTGVLVEIKHEVGETVPIGTVLGVIRTEGEEKAIEAVESRKPTPMREESPAIMARTTDTGKERKNISPLAREIAKREGIDLSKISVGSGPGGRIVKEDILRLVQKKGTKEISEPEKKAPTGIEAQEKVKFTSWRKVIADRMLSSSRNVPQASTIMEMDVTEIARLIVSTKGGPKQLRLTYLPFLMKAIQVSLSVAPEINAYCYDDGYIVQRELNIGVAVDLGEKLIVPVVKGVTEKSILELAEEIRDLAEKARAEKLGAKDVEGGTITLTNLGPFGAYAAVPLILQPQTTIIGIGAALEKPSVVNGSIEIRTKMMITGVFDHRVINGASGARFLREVKMRLEDPKALILKMR